VQQCLGLHSSSVIDLTCVLDAAYDSPTTSHPRHGSPWSGEFAVIVSDDFQHYAHVETSTLPSVNFQNVGP